MKIQAQNKVKFKRGNDCYIAEINTSEGTVFMTIEKRYNEWFLTIDGNDDHEYMIAETKRCLVDYAKWVCGEIKEDWPLNGVYC